MKRIAYLFFIFGSLLTVLLGSFALLNSNTAHADAELGDGIQSPAYGGQATTRPNPKSESYFYTDIGGDLDQYLYRTGIMTPSDELTFTIHLTNPVGLGDTPLNPATTLTTSDYLTFVINIDRFYSPLITTTALTPAGLVDPNVITTLINNHLLPPTATLQLQVFDVDHDAGGCAEVDQLYVNQQPVFDATGVTTATLNSGDEQWETWQIDLPIGLLRFPTQPGVNGNRPSVLNEIALDINTQCPEIPWAVKVDWGAIHIPNPLLRPIIFAHGWTGNSESFNNFYAYAQGDGIPIKVDVELADGVLPIRQTAKLLEGYVQQALVEFGVDKVNLFAHSKGGLVARYLLRYVPYGLRVVENLVTFGSPTMELMLSFTPPLCAVEMQATRITKLVGKQL